MMPGMRRWIGLGVLVVLAALGCEKQKRGGPGGGGGAGSGAGSGAAALDGPVYKLRDAVTQQLGQDRELAGVAVVWIAEIVGPQGRAAVVWPAIKDGKILDNDVIALAFRERDGRFEPIG